MNTAAPPSPDDTVGAAVARSVSPPGGARAAPRRRARHASRSHCPAAATRWLLLDVARGLARGARRRAVRGPRPPRPVAARRCVGGVLRRRVRAARRPAGAPSRARSRAAPGEPGGRRPRRALRALRRARRRRASRSPTTPTTRRRRCCCSCCAAPARTGLAAMPARRAPASGPTLLRPLLGAAARALDAYARRRAASPGSTTTPTPTSRIRRNFLRREVAPRLAAAFPGLPAHAAARRRAPGRRRAARRRARRARRADGREVDPVDGPTARARRLGALAALGAHRARNLLRWFLRQHGLRGAVGGAARRDAATARPAPRRRARRARARRRRARRPSRADRRPRARLPPWDARPWHGERRSRCRTARSSSRRPRATASPRSALGPRRPLLVRRRARRRAAAARARPAAAGAEATSCRAAGHPAVGARRAGRCCLRRRRWSPCRASGVDAGASRAGRAPRAVVVAGSARRDRPRQSLDSGSTPPRRALRASLRQICRERRPDRRDSRSGDRAPDPPFAAGRRG